MTTGKNVALKKDAPPPAVAYDYGADAGAGFEGMKGSELSVPFIAILQGLSPQVTDNPDVYRVGQLYNTVTHAAIDGKEGIGFIPVYRERAYVEWINRDDGGGFVALHDPDSQDVKAAIAANENKNTGKIPFSKIEGKRHELVETQYLYGLVLNIETGTVDGFAVISFTSTKLRVYRELMTNLRMLKGKPPLFANRLKITTVGQKNKAGQAYHNFVISPFGGKTYADSLIHPTEEADLLKSAKEFGEQVVNGLARAAFETQTATGDTDSEEGDGGKEALPF